MYNRNIKDNNIIQRVTFKMLYRFSFLHLDSLIDQPSYDISSPYLTTIQFNIEYDGTSARNISTRE